MNKQQIHPVLFCFIPVILILLLYSHILGYKMGHLDEDALERSLPVLRDSAIKEIARRDAFLSPDGMAFYRPVQNLSYMLDARAGITPSIMFRFTSVVLHALISILLMIMLGLFGVSPIHAMLFAVFFSVHPLFVHTVAWIPARGDLLMALFSISTICLFRLFQVHGKSWFLAAAVPLAALAVFSKETAIVLPLALIYLNGPKKPIRQALFFFIILVLIVALYLLIRNSVITAPFKDHFGITEVFRNGQVIPEAVAKLFLPFFYAPMPAFSFAATTSGLIIIILFAYLFYPLYKTTGYLFFFGIILFVLYILPGMAFSHSMADTGYRYLEHRLYFPSVGILLALAMYVEKRKLKIFWPALIIISVMFATAWHRTGDYREPEAFYTAAVKKNPKSAVAWYGRGNLYKESLQFDKAIADFSRALEIKPDYFEALNNRGIAYFNTKRYNEAITDYSHALSLQPRHAQTYNNRANAYSASGRLAEALTDYKKALALDSTLDVTYYNRGACYARMGKYDSALADFNCILRRDSLYTLAYVYRGFTWLSVNQPTKAIRDFSLAIQLSPKNAEFYTYRADAYYSRQQFSEAIADYTMALTLQPGNIALLIKRGLLYYNAGKKQQACEDWKSAENKGSAEAADFVKRLCKDESAITHDKNTGSINPDFSVEKIN